MSAEALDEVQFVRDELADKPAALAMFEQHIQHDREAIGFALAANIGPVRLHAAAAAPAIGEGLTERVRAALRDTLARYDAVIVLDPAKGYHYGAGPSPDFIADGVAARLRDEL